MNPEKADRPPETLDMLVLAALTLGPQHGFGIVRTIRQTSDDLVNVHDGAVYPALHRMVALGWVDAEWRGFEDDRRARYYALTRFGRRRLQARQAARATGHRLALAPNGPL